VEKAVSSDFQMSKYLRFSTMPGRTDVYWMFVNSKHQKHIISKCKITFWDKSPKATQNLFSQMIWKSKSFVSGKVPERSGHQAKWEGKAESPSHYPGVVE
jgi:hypothetical protein